VSQNCNTKGTTAEILPTALTALGCFQDTLSRILTGSSTTSSSMTPESCVAFCGSNGYGVAGVEFATQCYCGNTLFLSDQTSSSSCTMPCGGDSNQVCGGAYLLNVYEVPACSSSVTTGCNTKGSTADIVPVGGATATSVGCFQDTPSRILAGISTTSSSLTPESCLTFCGSNGYSIAGVEFSDQCYCGDTLFLSTQTSSSSCAMPCSGDDSQICGGAYLLNVYTVPACSSSVTTGCNSNGNTAQYVPVGATPTSSSSCVFCCSALTNC
jgi:glucan endo-1,3-alpha-glucosidase